MSFSRFSTRMLVLYLRAMSHSVSPRLTRWYSSTFASVDVLPGRRLAGFQIVRRSPGWICPVARIAFQARIWSGVTPCPPAISHSVSPCLTR